ncbi:hypothetical protein DL764_008132 [Monosporascus ibericus]|uniref:Uncharacterized protein n=1 Tax=Monosporascus ibericus TaxID=155417 RepID=A0A4Q4T0E5_9PEZI|nr:hypothetical protein DL764_008132 [Monosporascus ibericus]
MGAAVSAFANALGSSQRKEAHAKERLELKVKLADAQLGSFEVKLKTMLLAKESAQRTSIPGKGAFQGVEHSVNASFGVSDTGTKGVLDGFKSVVKTGLSTILWYSSAGESYDEKFFVSIKEQGPPSNAIIRPDMRTCWTPKSSPEMESVGPNGGYELYFETIMKTWNALNSVEVPPRIQSNSTEVYRSRNGLRNHQAQSTHLTLSKAKGITGVN